MAIPNYDSPLAFMDFSPALGQVTWTWNCDPFECVGQGTGNVIGGLTGGVILFDGATFKGLILGGTFEEDKIIDVMTGQPFLDTQTFNYSFSGVWANGWSTVGDASADIELNARPFSSYQITTYTPEPGTMILTSGFLAAAYGRTRSRMRSGESASAELNSTHALWNAAEGCGFSLFNRHSLRFAPEP